MDELISNPSVIGVGLAVLGSRDILTKMLGPSADYIGGELKGLVEKCNVNVNNVFSIAHKKLAGKLDKPGEVNPRVLKHVMEEAVFCEDPLVAEYLGGVLASARSEDGRDDRGVCFLTDIKSLSVYQLRTHCLMYSAIARAADKMQMNPASYYGEEKWESIVVVFSDDDYSAGMAYKPSEEHDALAKHSFLGLQSRQLGSSGLTAYEGEDGEDTRFVRPFRSFSPTRYGHELFAWGLGHGDRKLTSYFDITPDLIPAWIPQIEIACIDTGGTRFGGVERTYPPKADAPPVREADGAK